MESSKIGRVIGRGGATIQALREKTGCEVTVDQSQLVVVITGPTSTRVNAAERLVVMARDEGGNKVTAALGEALNLEEEAPMPSESSSSLSSSTAANVSMCFHVDDVVSVNRGGDGLC